MHGAYVSSGSGCFAGEEQRVLQWSRQFCLSLDTADAKVTICS